MKLTRIDEHTLELTGKEVKEAIRHYLSKKGVIPPREVDLEEFCFNKDLHAFDFENLYAFRMSWSGGNDGQSKA